MVYIFIYCYKFAITHKTTHLSRKCNNTLDKNFYGLFALAERLPTSATLTVTKLDLI